MFSQIVSRLLNSIIMTGIRMYRRLISPLLPSRCRFYPSCSEYCLMVFQQYSFIKALVLSLKRLSKCHPFHVGGVDFPPTTHRRGKST